MRVSFEQGEFYAFAETVEDVEILLGLVDSNKKTQPKPTRKTPKKKPYKRQYSRECQWCHGIYKGAVGMGIHQRKCPERPGSALTHKVVPESRHFAAVGLAPRDAADTDR